MRRVKARNTGPEKTVRALLRSLGHTGYRLDRRNLPGTPDIAFISKRRAIFVHGCFWHGHECKRGARTPKTNTEYWTAKIAGNRARDTVAAIALKKLGWGCLTIWECELKDHTALNARLTEFLSPAP